MADKQAANVMPLPYDAAVRRLLAEFSWNPWFLHTYWPENEPRVRVMAQLALADLPAKGRTLEVGCANGYVAYLFHLLGFDVVAVDAYDDEKRAQMFSDAGIVYQETNLNDVEPLREFASETFDLVLLGEVFEHILNEPAGLLKGIMRVLRPGGTLILTTPNPSTIMNAVRLLRDRYVLWGTAEFLRQTKLIDGKVIDRGDIHYREYPAWLVRELMTELGFEVGCTRYVRAGVAPTQSYAKRWAKRLLWASGLGRLRLFCPGYVIGARRPLSC